jgi:hypothetical protein
LVRYGETIGLPKKWGVADTTDSKNIMKGALDNVKANLIARKPELATTLSTPATYLTAISKYKTKRITPDLLQPRLTEFKETEVFLEVYTYGRAMFVITHASASIKLT